MYEGKRKKEQKMDDVKIIEAFFKRDECAVVELERKHGKIYRAIINNVLSDSRDVEECLNDTYLAVWNTIPPNSPRSLLAYVSTIARSCAIDKLRYNTREKRDESQLVLLEELDEYAVSSDVPDEDCRELINELLASQPVRARVIFIRRYYYLEAVSSIAERFGMSENAVSASLFRTREKLRKALIKKGVMR